MKRLLLITSFVFSFLAASAQSIDTTSFKGKLDFDINRIKGLPVFSHPNGAQSLAYKHLSEGIQGRVPHMSISDLRAGKADFAPAVFITDPGKEGILIYTPGNVLVDDSVIVVKAGARTFVRDMPDGINPRLFGADTDSTTNDLAAFEKAAAKAVFWGKPLRPTGTLLLDTEGRGERRIITPRYLKLIGYGKTSSKIIFSINARLTPRSNTRIEGITFNGQSSVEAIKTLDEERTSNIEIVNNRFEGGLQKGIHVNAALPNTYHTDILVEDNEFVNVPIPYLQIRGRRITVNQNNITSNIPDSRGLMIFGGQFDKYTNNYINGTLITGITLAFQRSTAGAQGVIHDILIDNNDVIGYSEEGISTDTRVNEPTNMAPRETFAIATKSISGSTYRIHAPGDWSAGGSHFDYYAYFVTGRLKGEIAKITGHTAGSSIFSLGVDAKKYSMISTSDTVVIGAPYFNIQISNNRLEGPSKTSAICIFGLTTKSSILSNSIIYTGTGVQYINQIPISAIGLTSVIGIDPTGSITGKRIAPVENVTVEDNKAFTSSGTPGTGINGGASMQSNFARFAGNQFPVKGNKFINNTADFIRLQYSEDNTSGNILNYGIIREAVTRSVDSTARDLYNKNFFGFKMSLSDTLRVSGAPSIFQRTTEPVRIGYSSSVYTSLATTSGGGFSITPTGGIIALNGRLTGGNDSSNVFIPTSRGILATNKGGYNLPGTTNTALRVGIGSSTNDAIPTNAAYANLILRTQQVTASATGSHQEMGNLVVKPLTITNTSNTVPYAASVIVTGPAEGATRNGSLWIMGGRTRLDGDLSIGLIPASATAATKFLTVSADSVVSSRTNAQLVSDLGVIDNTSNQSFAGAKTSTGSIVIQGELNPSIDATKTLGKPGLRWAAAYIRDFIKDGTGAGMTFSATSSSTDLFARFSTNNHNFILQAASGTATADDNINKAQIGGSVKATQYRLSALNTAPATATSTGVLGEIRITADFIYVCIATNVWVRSPLSTW